MQINEYLNNQKQIFWELLAATVLELDLYPDIAKGEFSFGANETVLSFRNCGRGILAGKIARAVLPETEGGLTERHLSELYPLDALLETDLFELHSFHGGEATLLRYEKGSRTELRVYPDFNTPEGLLVHLEWGRELLMTQVLQEKDVASAMRRVMSPKSPLPKLRWRPAVWFNGKRVAY